MFHKSLRKHLINKNNIINVCFDKELLADVNNKIAWLVSQGNIDHKRGEVFLGLNCVYYGLKSCIIITVDIVPLYIPGFIQVIQDTIQILLKYRAVNYLVAVKPRR